MQPVQPMLAQPAEDIADALAQLGEAAFEWKLDGARIQVHKDGDEVRVFTRRLNDVTAAVPEIVSAVRGLPLASAILDGEAIALRPDGRPQPFQITMRRFGRQARGGAAAGRVAARLPVLRCAGAGWRGADRPAERGARGARSRRRCRRRCWSRAS